MGRAIDMEKDIDTLKIKVEELENIVRGMSHQLDEAAIPLTVRGEKFNKDGAKINPNSKETKVTHIDLVDDVKKETDDVKQEEDSNDKKKKTNSKGSGRSTKSSDTDGGVSKKQSKSA